MKAFLVALIGLIGFLQSSEAACQCNSQSYNLVPGSPMQISSPNFPNSYGSGCNCKYNFTVPPNYVVGFQFPFFFLGSTDTLRISSGGNGLSQSCYNTQCPNFNSSGTFAMVSFISVNPGPGFQMSVQAVQLNKCNCGPNMLSITQPGGKVGLMSPGFGSPQPFDGKCMCSWTINAPQYYKLNFTFAAQNTFDQMCFYNGNYSMQSQLISCCSGPHCKNMVQTLSNALTVTYKSSFQNHGGFKGQVAGGFVQGCDFNPCSVRGTCQNRNTPPYFFCQCPVMWTGVTCQLPACLLTVQNQGYYFLTATYSSRDGVTSVTLARGQQKFFTAVADTYITLHAVYGRTARLIIPQCAKSQIVCTGTTIINFGCNYVASNGKSTPIEFYPDTEIAEEKIVRYQEIH